VEFETVLKHIQQNPFTSPSILRETYLTPFTPPGKLVEMKKANENNYFLLSKQQKVN